MTAAAVDPNSNPNPIAQLLDRITTLETELSEAHKTIGRLYLQLEHKKYIKAHAMKVYREKKLASSIVALRAIQNGATTVVEVANAVQMSRHSTNRILRELTEQGKIQHTGKLFTAVPVVTAAPEVLCQ